MIFTDPTNYSLPSSEQAQKQVFGEETKKDMADYSQAAYNYLMHQQDNALQIAMMNYMNEYNSPQHQMLMRQAAGLNPYSFGQGVQSAGASLSGSPQFRSNGTYAKGVQATMNGINNLLGIVETGSKLYDYLTYGRDLSKYQVNAAVGRSGIINEQLQQAVWNTAWQGYLLGAEGYGGLANTPQGQRYQEQTHQLETSSTRNLSSVSLNAERIKQIEWLINNLYPEQKERTIALAELDKYRLSILQGQSDAILRINTGNSMADSLLQFLLFLLKDNVGNLTRLL